MRAKISVRGAVASDLDTARDWLTNAGLPSADLTPGHMRGFLIAEVGDESVGMIGLEAFGELGLLRSLVVDDAHRGAGIGKQLVSGLEKMAAAAGITQLWLLTIDAEAYFADLGFTLRSRDDVPDAIRGSREFSSLCPGDAALMSKG